MPHQSSAQPRVLVLDIDLVTRAHDTFRSIPFESPMDHNWNWRASANGFSLFMHEQTDRHEVLAAGEILCSIEEVMHVLRATTEYNYNTAMTAMFENKFVCGSIVHVLPRKNLATMATKELHVTDKTHVAVKTAVFARSRKLAKNE